MRHQVRMRMPRLARTWHARTSDGGFTLIEVLTAIGIFAVVMMLLSAMLATGMRGVLGSKRREVATQEANRQLEFARSLSYDEVGLAQNDPTIAGDPAITTVGGVQMVAVDGVGNFEPVIWATNPTGNPYNPHRQTTTRASTRLETFVYVTGVDTDGDGNLDMKRITARIVWDDTGSRGSANEVRAQTFLDESGNFLTGTPPDGGESCPGCTGTPPMSARAQTSGGSVSVRSDVGNLLSLEDAELPETASTATLPRSTGSTKYRSVSDISCTAESAWLQSPTGSYGNHSVTVAADDDAATATQTNPPAGLWSGLPADPVGSGDEIDRLLVETAISSPASCEATGSAADDGLPFEEGEGSGPGTLTLTESLLGAGLPSDTLTILSLGAAANSQSIDHDPVASGREIHAAADGTLGKTQFMKIPSVFPEGLVEVSAFGYGASVTAAPGTPTQAPTVTVPGGITLKIYDPTSQVDGCSSRNSNYCFLTIDPTQSGFSGHTASVNTSLTSGLTKLIFEVDVQAFPPTKDPLDGVPDGDARLWNASYKALNVTARLKVEVTVDLLLGTKVILTDSEISMSLGNVNAWGCAGVGCDVKVNL